MRSFVLNNKPITHAIIMIKQLLILQYNNML